MTKQKKMNVRKFLVITLCSIISFKTYAGEINSKDIYTNGLQFLESLFLESELIEKNDHICLLKNEIMQKNKEKKIAHESVIEEIYNNVCGKTNKNAIRMNHIGWNDILYRSVDGKIFCKRNRDCAEIVYEDENEIALYWNGWGTVELFEKKEDFFYEHKLKNKNIFTDSEVEDEVTIYLPIGHGIGNQLFAYWSGKVYAHKNSKKVFIDDIGGIKNVMKVTDEKKQTITAKEEKKKNIMYAIFGYKKYGGNKIPDDNFISIGGYLQDYENLKGYEEYIQNNTILNEFKTEKSKEISKKMRSENSVVLHVRRGDYIGQGYYVLAPSYYEKGIKYIKERVQNPHFYIFSNDINWAKENLKIDGEHTFVDWNKYDYEDLQLMTYGKHFIIANSTFSWWGAFLSKNKDKIVIMPDRWATWNKDWIKQIFVPKWIIFNVENDVLNEKSED